MQIVINVPEDTYRRKLKDTLEVILSKETTVDAIILPAGHGRLIDADDIDNHIIGHVDTRSCPTIIEEDKAESEDKE